MFVIIETKDEKQKNLVSFHFTNVVTIFNRLGKKTYASNSLAECPRNHLYLTKGVYFMQKITSRKITDLQTLLMTHNL